MGEKGQTEEISRQLNLHFISLKETINHIKDWLEDIRESLEIAEATIEEIEEKLWKEEQEKKVEGQ